MAALPKFLAGFRLVTGDALNNIIDVINNLTGNSVTPTGALSAQNGITATSGGTQGTSLQLSAAVSRVTTVAAANDSVKLPVASPGLQITVINAAAANSMNVFPSLGDAINALAANTAFAVAANKSVIFTCAVAGVWNTNLTA